MAVARGRRPAMAVALLALLLTLAACPARGPSALLHDNELTARTFMAIRESGELDELAHIFYGDAVYDDFPNQVQYRGLEEIAGYLTYFTDWATAVSLGVSAVHPSETGATIEWVFSGVQERPIGGMVEVSTGRDVLLHGVTILEIEGDRIRRAADYVDMLPLVLQLGSEIRLPGGNVMKLDLEPVDAVPGAPDGPGGDPDGDGPDFQEDR
jgi:hypothetical protein